MKNIYGKFLKRKKLYYFLQYYKIITQISTNEFITLFNETHKNDIISYTINNEEQNNNLNLYNKNICINSSSQLIHDSYPSSIGHSLIEETNPFFNNTERISINNNFKKVNKSLINNENENMMDIFMKNSINSNYNNKNRRTQSYGHLEIKKNKNDLYKVFSNEDNNNNCTESLKAIFPSYTITSPNEILYPIIFTNNSNNNNIKNDNLNNNILYNYNLNTPINSNDLRNIVSKPSPSFWYTNYFSSINPIPIIQNNNYSVQIPKILNNSAIFNSVSSINYTEDYLNKQIYDFVNANNQTKQNIISNISKKHNINLNKSNGAIKINEDKNKNKTLHNNDKSIKRKNKSYSKNNINIKKSKLVLDKINNDNYPKGNKTSKLFNGRETNDMSDSISKTDINILNNLSINKYSNNNIDSTNEIKYKKKINKINNNYTNFTKNKNTKKNCMNEYNKYQSKKQKDSLNDKKFNKILNNKKINSNNNEFCYETKANKSYNINGSNNIINNNKQKIISHDNNKEFINPSLYEINNVVDEEFKNEKNIGKNEEEQNNSLKMSKMSMQSINDSKMLELANNYVDVDDMDIFDMGRINDILNNKNTQKIMKK